MANVENSNTIFIDSTATLQGNLQTKVCAIVAAAVGGAGRLTLADAGGSNPTKIDVAILSGDTKFLRFPDNVPVLFPNGIKVTTATNVKATLLVRYAT